MATPTPTPSSLTLVPAQLPEVIIAEILKRLPVKTIVQFKCVCKSWRKLLTDPIFTNTHLHFTPPTRIILSRYFKSFLSLPLHPNPNPEELPLSLNDGHTYYVKGHCNGLLLLIISNGTIILWNPSIARYRTLPTPSSFKETREVLGFGYDSSTNDYKIVRAPSSYCKFKVKDYNPQIEVLSLNSNSWRILPEAETPPYFIEHSQQSLYLNAAVYWLAFDDFSTLILRFDLAKESFARVPPPRDDTGTKMSWIGVINDSLCVLHSHQRSYFDIWATRDDFNWEKMFTVSKIVDPEPCFSYLDYAPLCFIETGELLMSIRPKGLVAYDPNKHRYRRIALLEDARWLQETVYTDSLVFPDEPLELDPTGSSSGALTSVISQMLLGFSNAFTSRFACPANSRNKKNTLCDDDN